MSGTLTAQTATMDGPESITNASVIFIREFEHQLVNSSETLCNISSLGVYRGREQTTEISHDGFSLGHNGTIEVHAVYIAYYKMDELFSFCII